MLKAIVISFAMLTGCATFDPPFVFENICNWQLHGDLDQKIFWAEQWRYSGTSKTRVTVQLDEPTYWKCVCKIDIELCPLVMDNSVYGSHR